MWSEYIFFFIHAYERLVEDMTAFRCPCVMHTLRCFHIYSRIQLKNAAMPLKGGQWLPLLTCHDVAFNLLAPANATSQRADSGKGLNHKLTAFPATA